MSPEEAAEMVLGAVDFAGHAAEMSDEPMEDMRSGGMSFFFDMRVGDQWFIVTVAQDPYEDGTE